MARKHRSRSGEPAGRIQNTNKPVPVGLATEVCGKAPLLVCYPHPGRVGDLLWAVKRHHLACRKLDGQLRVAYEVWGDPVGMQSLTEGGMIAEWHYALAGRVQQISVGMGPEKLPSPRPVWQERLMAEPDYTNDELAKEKPPKITLCKEWQQGGYQFHFLRVTPRKGAKPLEARSQSFHSASMAKAWLKAGKVRWFDGDSMPPNSRKPEEASGYSNEGGWVGK